MLEYSFVSVAVKRRREGLRLANDYQDIVRARAVEGWEFVQAIPFDSFTEPHIDLVFSRKGDMS